MTPLRYWLGVALFAAATSAFAAAEADAPAVKVPSPQQNDLAWQQASAKFEPQRQALLQKVAKGDAAGPFRADWASLQAYRSPSWYDDAKFGIFIHWGVYSVPAFGSEWYSRDMYVQGSKEFAHHVATYGAQSQFGYKDFIPRFKAEHFDPAAWAALFREAGARYVVPVAEHHDGFAMYDSKLSDWTAVKMGPKRDVIGQLSKAIRAQGMHFGLSSHRAEHDWFMGNGREFASDVSDPRYAEFYGPAQQRMSGPDSDNLASDFTYVSQAWLDDWLARTTELIDDYHPDLIYFDWWIGHPTFRNSLPKMLAYYYNQSAALSQNAARGGVVVNYKFGEFADGAGVLDVERGQLSGIHPTHWQTDTSISEASWGYIEHDTYKSPQTLIHLLVDVVSKNGNLLLNIGPRADGVIPQGAQDVLRQIGGWLKVNAEAIYGSKPWRVFGEGPTETVGGTFQDTKTKPYTAADFRFTTGNGKLYAIELGWPTDGKAVIHAIKPADGVRSVQQVADGKPVSWQQKDDGLHLTLPAKPVGEYAYVLRIELASSPEAAR
ncbi:alpha-L-fucosidase [Dyella silvatica]|uniref:alpha-L-fucosidase n=1 Tax=Dyella silvatica TaxID=2992128 RepID=UPI002251D953|nr:alpha-L-fucosidase [Dyella silvatica]